MATAIRPSFRQRHAAPAPSISSRVNTLKQQLPISLAKRLLFPHLPDGAEPPPLFASPSCSKELNDEVYDLIALALRAYVNTWWSKISRYDKEVLPQITHILTFVLRELETRILAADLSAVVFLYAPCLITQHYRDYRNAKSKLSTSYATGGAASLSTIFHHLQPHIAISEDGQINEEYYRQLFNHVLRFSLPSEDYAPDVERFIIREIILKVLLKDTIPKISQPWFIQKTILDFLDTPPDIKSIPNISQKTSSPSPSFSFHALLIIFLSAVQSISGLCLTLTHAYKQAFDTIKRVNETSYLPINGRAQPAPHSPPKKPTSSSEDIEPPTPSSLSSLSNPTHESHHESGHESDLSEESPPHLADQCLTVVFEVFSVRCRFASSALAHYISLLSFIFASFLNRLLSYLLYTQVLSSSSILSVLRLSKRTLFPYGYPGPPPVDPTPEEQIVIRQRLLERLGGRMPPLISRLVLGPSPLDTISDAIDPLGDATCNTHLAVLMLDAVLLEIFPEMGVDYITTDPHADASVASNWEKAGDSSDSKSGRSSSVSFTPPDSIP
ncbi:hypothetical protein SERLA73DRAFT_85045 [Serpula lacrymans var. lacrymans S7.3]|uniref:PXA domain-containing protein n=2 Tax=Serpula lacrymans var. lacrymans TaxID=341189 RepID=F8PNF4_SERL3|nr:uncharacterized protein SERLADRAFT_434792 [Serpula lacrymans var. lacrymans S7.9]EGO03136.1 hypothetical protein SERLA73DRAFT_85045 [Serpula lacrymans var. lacrymans S7.3]EGO28902.1 hypothetical protein SERLADRAFT_434792 [Serpula lacrymans var. lacrymans S7.9]